LLLVTFRGLRVLRAIVLPLRRPLPPARSVRANARRLDGWSSRV